MSLVLVLWLGLTVSAALFVVADGILFRPLPVRDPDHLVVAAPAGLFRRGRPSALNAGELAELAGLPGVTGVAAYTEKAGDFEERFAREEALTVASVTDTFFGVLGVAMQCGRPLARADGTTAEPRPAVIGDALWRSRFGRSRDVVGRVVRLGGRQVEIVGVAPEGFDIPRGTNVWLANVPVPASAISIRALMPIVRLRGPTLGSEARLRGEPLVQERLRDHFRPDGGAATAVLFVATLVAVLIAWIHLASLQVGQALDRWRELALRAALGAGRWRLAGEWVTESLVLNATALAGSVIALPATVALLVHLLPPDVTRGQPIGISWRVLAFLGALTVAGAVAMALGPILVMRPERLFDGLRGQALAVPVRSRGAARLCLVGAQAALVASLLYVAGLAVHRFADVAQRDLGIDAEYVMAIDLPADAEEIGPLDSAGLLERLRRVPFVTKVATGTIPVLSGKTLTSVLGHAPRSMDQLRGSLEVVFDASPEYFDALGIRVLWGSAANTDRTSDSVLLSESMARALDIRSARDNATVYVGGLRRQVVGVVSDVWGDGPDASAPGRYVYLSSPRPRSSLIVRTSKPAAAVLRRVEEAVREATGVGGPIASTLGADLVGRATVPARSRASILVLLAFACLGLGGVGVFSVARDAARHEVAANAIRSALGATPARLIRRQMAWPMAAVAGGLAAGLAGGFEAGRFVSGLVEGMPAADPLVGGCVSAVLLGVGLAAAVGPAVRSARADTMTLLRAD